MVRRLLKAEPSGRTLAEESVLELAIDELVATNPNQLSRREYHYLADLLAGRVRKTGCRLLVFGVGWDSVIWLWLNRAGQTVFLEDCARWAEQLVNRVPSAIIVPVHYGTRLAQWRDLLDGMLPLLALPLPPPILETRWDLIFVDGPQGFDGVSRPNAQHLHSGLTGPPRRRRGRRDPRLRPGGRTSLRGPFLWQPPSHC